MTQNQLKRDEIAEQKRANQVSEKQRSRELGRKDAELAETRRSNRASEALKLGKMYVDSRNATKAAGAKALPALLAANDPAWYRKYPKLLEDAGRFSFGRPIGGLDVEIYQKSEGEGRNKKIAVPGVMAISWFPSIGQTEADEATAINVAIKNIYAYVRHANSGHTNYEAADLFKYILAVDSLYTHIAFMEKIYSLLLSAKAGNYYYVRQMVEAHHVNYNDMINHIADLRYHINYAIARAKVFRVPNTMTLFQRHQFMAQGIFKDNNITKSSEYVFVPEVLYKYDESLTPGRLSAQKYINPFAKRTSEYMNYNGFWNFTNTLLDALIGSEDINIMAGDILKAYGENGLYSVNYMPDDFHIESIYSEEVLSQINTATLCGPCVQSPWAFKTSIPVNAGLDIVEDGQGRLKQGDENNGFIFSCTREELENIPHRTNNKNRNPNGVLNPVVNMYKDEVTPDDVMVATRLAVTLQPGQTVYTVLDGDESVTYPYYNFAVNTGSEVCTTATIRCIGLETLGAVTKIEPEVMVYYDMRYVRESIPELFGAMIAQLNLWGCIINSFDWAPAVQLSYAIASDAGLFQITTEQVVFNSRDYSNYYVVQFNDLRNLHYVALLSELDG